MPQRYLDDFMPGEVFTALPHTLSEKHFAAFAAMTGDAHPLHYEADYARDAGTRRWRTGCCCSACARSARRRSAVTSPNR